MKMNNKLYDILSNIGKYILPTSAVLYVALAEIWELPFANEISLTLTALVTALNSLLGLSSIEYYKKEEKEVEEIRTKVFNSLPSITSPYFIKKSSGGYSDCIAGKKQQGTGSTLNNCVGACWGLFAMAEENPNCKVGYIAGVEYPQGAGSWWNGGNKSSLDKYERGQEPKIGSIICYGNHVAYVNEITKDGNLKLIYSSYGDNVLAGLGYYTVYKDNNYAWNSAGNFQGFIYPKEIKI